MPTVKENQSRYIAACHAMQSGVAMQMHRDPTETSPKHLRVGMNSALVSNGALVQLLIKKGVFTEEEWWQTLADKMEEEVKSYEAKLPGNVKFV